MNKGLTEPITLIEREHFDRRRGRRLVFSATGQKLPDCPKCGHNRKVYKAAGVFVCTELHS